MDLLSVGIEPVAQVSGGDGLIDVASDLIENLVGETQRCLIWGLSALAIQHAEQVRDIAPNGVHVVGVTGDLAEQRDGRFPDLARQQIFLVDVAPGTSEPREGFALLDAAFNEGQQLLLKLFSEAHRVVP